MLSTVLPFSDVIVNDTIYVSKLLQTQTNHDLLFNWLDVTKERKL